MSIEFWPFYALIGVAMFFAVWAVAAKKHQDDKKGKSWYE